MTIIPCPVPYRKAICDNMAVAASIVGRATHATGRKSAVPEAEPVPSAESG